jgi:citronellol/citronellal dehydrogenase
VARLLARARDCLADGRPAVYPLGMTRSLRGKTLFITGASRGIGKAIALRAAQDGANVAVVAKTKEAHPKLPGTVFSARDEIIAAGGRALALVVDIRSDDQVASAVDATVQEFGGIDILVNNASAIHLSPTAETPMKRYDLMQSVNTRGTFLCSQACLPHLTRSDNPHILTLSPPPALRPEWFAPHLAYTLSKYGMSLCTLGLAEELKALGIAVNSLWPRTLIATSAVEHLLGGEEVFQHSRHPSIMADAAHRILTSDARSTTGNFFIDEQVLRANGVSDLGAYSVNPANTPQVDLFVEDTVD